jgi:hypothetical protein
MRTVVADLSQEGFLDKLAEATNDLDIGLVVSNASTPNPGEFLKLDRQLLQATLRLNTMAHKGRLARKLGFRSWRTTAAPRRISTVSGKRSTTGSSLGASALPSCRPR